MSIIARALLSSAAVPFAVGIGFASPAFAQSATAAAGASDTAATTTQKQTALPAVAVSAKAESTAAAPTFGGGEVSKEVSLGALGKQKVLDVPFSVTNYTEKMIENQQAQTLADVLDKDPNVRSSLGYGNFSQTFTIRGFQLESDDISLDGLYGLTPRQMVSTDVLGSVQLFKGTSAFLNGVPPGGTAVGGGVNVELKRADDKPLNRVTMETSASGQFGEHIDIGRRFGDNDQYGIRFNQSTMSGNTGIDKEDSESRVTSLSLDYRGDKVRLYADFLYQREKIDQGRSVTYVTGTSVPEVPSATSNYAQPWTYSNLEDTVGILRGEYDFAPGWTAYVAGGVHHSNEYGEYSSPSYASATSTTADGEAAVFKQDSLSGQVGVRGKFDTGPVSHQVNISASITQVTQRSAYAFQGLFSPFSTSLYNTAESAMPAADYSGGNMADPSVVSRVINKGLSFSDTMGFFNDRVLFTAGAREQNINVRGYDYNTKDETSAYDSSLLSPIFGIVIKATQNLSFYANRSEALAEGGTAPSTATNVGQIFAPYRTKQYEAGVKYDAGKYGANAAVFQITEPTAYTNAVTKIYSVSGEERHRGVELGIYGEPVKGLRLLAGASMTDAKLTETGDSTTQGNVAVGVPRWLGNIGAEYDIPHVSGLTVTANWIYTSKQYLNQTNTLSIPAWNRFDIGARYTTQVFRHDVTIRGTIQNLANHAYWSSAYDGYLTMGAPRTFLLSLTTDF